MILFILGMILICSSVVPIIVMAVRDCMWSIKTFGGIQRVITLWDTTHSILVITAIGLFFVGLLLILLGLYLAYKD